MCDDLYALWLTWGTSGNAHEWAALVMEVCQRTEDQTDDAPKTEQEAQNV